MGILLLSSVLKFFSCLVPFWTLPTLCGWPAFISFLILLLAATMGGSGLQRERDREKKFREITNYYREHPEAANLNS
jgi:hypothetical protein